MALGLAAVRRARSSGDAADPAPAAPAQPSADAQVMAYLQRHGLVVPTVTVAQPTPTATQLGTLGAVPGAPTAAEVGLDNFQRAAVAGGLVAPRPDVPMVSQAAIAHPATRSALNAGLNVLQSQQAASDINQQVASIASPKAAAPGEPPAEPVEAEQAATSAPAAAPFAGPRVIPGGHDPKRNPIRKETLEAMDAAKSAQREAMERIGQDEAAAQIQRAETIDANAKALADFDASVKGAEAIRSQQYAKRESDLQGAQEEAYKLGQIDPDRRYGRADTGTKMALVIGGALGGMLQGLRGGGRNDFMDSVNQAIDRDIDAQKTLASAADRRVQNMRGQLAFFKDRLGDERSAEAAQRIHLLDQFRLGIEKMAAGQQSVAVQDNARLAIAQMDDAIAKEKAQYRDIPEFRPAQVVGGASPTGPVKGMDALFVPELGGYARDPEEAKKLREQTGNGAYIIQQLEGIAGKARKIGAFDKAASKFGYKTADLEAVERDVSALAQPIVAYFGGGAAGDQEAERTKSDVIGSLRMGVEPEVAVRGAIGRMRERKEAYRRGAGIREGTETFALNQQGQRVPVGQFTGKIAAPRGAMPASFKPGVK